jgi:PAS domain S-box-containing protein
MLADQNTVAAYPGDHSSAERRSEQQAFVANLGQIALAGADLDIVFDRACDGLRRLLDMDRSSIYEASADRSALIFRHGAGWDDAVEFVQAIPLDHATPPGVAYQSRTAVVLGNYPESHYAGGIVQQIGAVSGVSVPIGNSEWNRFGVLSTHSLTPRAVSDDDSAFVTSVANVLAAAIDQRERQAELEALIGDSPDVVARFDRHLHPTFANPAFVKAFPVAAELDDAWNCALRKTLKSREPVLFETATAAGSILEVRAVPEFVGSDLLGVLCVGRDVTDRKLNEALFAKRAQKQHAVAQLGRDLLRADSSEFLRDACVAVARALETELVLVIAADHPHSTITVEAAYGYPDSLRGQTFNLASSGCASWTLSHPGPTVVENVEHEMRFRVHPVSLQAGARSGICVAIPDADQSWGVIITYSRTPRTFDGSDVDFLSSVAHLLSAAIYRRRMEQKLEHQRIELQELVDNAPDLICRFASDTTVLYINEAVKVAGISPEQVLGRHMSLIPMPAAVREAWVSAIERVVESGARHAVELDIVNGLHLEVRFAPELEADRVVSVLAIGRDITERRRAEEDQRKLQTELEQAKRVASIGRLGTTVAHEFNNVLMSISPFAELIGRSCREQQQIARAAQHILNAVVRGRRVTQEIMRFARPAEPAVEVIDLSAWLPATVQGLRPSLGETEVRVVVPGVRLRANIDRQQMEQVLANLMVNAADAVSGRRDGLIEIVLSRSQHDSVEIAVRDNGCGMPPEVVTNIFEPFFTTKRSGTGLGLPVVNQIIQSHGGSIEVSTDRGIGTTFRLLLPQVTEAVEAEPEKSVELEARSILLVEDNDAVADGIVGLLQMYGATVQRVATGKEAFAAITSRPPDAVILDVSLPDADGIELFTIIRPSHPELPVIFSTGENDQPRLRNLLGDRRVGVLIKPYDLGELTDALASVMNGN